MFSKKIVLLLSLLILKALVVMWVISQGFIGLGPDEAQYWTWSQTLDWGYYSKPPAIAWLIFGGTSLFGNNEFGVRFGALLVGFLLPLLVYGLALQCRLSERAAFWAALCMAFSPIGLAASFFATTDGGMVLFWILACMIMVVALRDNKKPNYLVLGSVIALGALFKWPIYLFWVFPLIYRRLWDKTMIEGLLVSLLGLLPSFIWNWNHNWVTFRHVFATVNGGNEASHGNFLEFIGAQAGLISPILFVLLLIAFFSRKKMPPQIAFCAISCGTLVLVLAAASFFQKIQGNWGVFAYPAGFVFLCWFFEDSRWLKAGVAVSALLCSAVIALPYLQSQGINIPYKLNPFRHNMGWNALTIQLKEAGYNPKTDFLFGDKYQTSSLLSYYGDTQQRAYFFNLQGIRQNQFSYWPGMAEERLGGTGYFVIAENSPHLEKKQPEWIENYQNTLSEYFTQVEYLGLHPLFEIDGKTVKGAFIFKCAGYNGQSPEKVNLF